MTGCYLLHFEPRYKNAGHYLGWAEDINTRTAEHISGKSRVRLVESAVGAGCVVLVVRIWPGAGRDDERVLKGGMFAKRKGSNARLCPLCNPGNKRGLLNGKHTTDHTSAETSGGTAHLPRPAAP